MSPEDSTPKNARRRNEDDALHSVFNEPNIFPGRPDETIEADWRCGNCGYNLRGLVTGNRCPECGEIELYRPPPAGEASYGAWYSERRATTTDAHALLVLLIVIVASGPLAVVGSMFSMTPSAITSIVFGPATEEVMKIVAILLIVETRPYLVRRETEIRIAAAAGAIGFAIIENILYLTIYIASPTIGISLWRWIVCTALHLGCTLIAAEGVVAIWRESDEQKRAPVLKSLMRPLGLAIVLHGSYNAIVTFAHWSGVAF